MKKIIVSIIVIGLLLTTSVVSVNVVSSKACRPFIYVDDDAPPGGDGSYEHPFQTITEGLDVAEDGDTVFVFSGTYNEEPIIYNSINLIGEARDSTIITKPLHINTHHVTVKGFTTRWVDATFASNLTFSGNKVVNVSYSGWSYAIEAYSHSNIIGNIVTNVGGISYWSTAIQTGSHSNIIGNIVTNVSAVGYARAIELGINSNHCNIIGNTVTNMRSGEYGFTLAIETGVRSSHCNITGNTITNLNGFRAYGISSVKSSFNTIIGNDISDIIGYFADGIDVYGETTTITGNTISNIIGDYAYGISMEGETNTITENTISNCNKHCIYLEDSQFITITENTIVNNSRGIYLGKDCRNNIVSKNTITNNGEGIGIGRGESSIGYASNNKIIGNNITDTAGYGINCEEGSRNNHIYYNNFINNGENAYDVGVINTWYKFKLFGKSMGNYWDDYTGQDNDGDGIGDTPYKISGKIIPSKDWYPVMEPFDIENIEVTYEMTEEMTEEMTVEESELLTQLEETMNNQISNGELNLNDLMNSYMGIVSTPSSSTPTSR